MKILFITDAAADLRPEMTEGKPIVIVPTKIIAGGREFRDYYDVTPEDYWEMLKTLPEVPTTAMPSPEDYLKAYREARENGYTHICVTQISSTASGTMNSALLARDMFYEEDAGDIVIEVIDSLNYTMAYGHTVLEGVKMAAEGSSFEKITARIKELCGRAEVVFGVFTLKYLRKSGRVTGMAAVAGELLGIRPILLAGKGEVRPMAKVRGDKNVIDGIVEYVKKRKNSAEKYMGILHSDISKEVISRLENMLEQHFGVKNLPKFKLGAAVTSHAGPLTLGVLFYS